MTEAYSSFDLIKAVSKTTRLSQEQKLYVI
jgi:hypothetical protein